MKDRILAEIELFGDGCISPYVLVRRIKEYLEDEEI